MCAAVRLLAAATELVTEQHSLFVILPIMWLCLANVVVLAAAVLPSSFSGTWQSVDSPTSFPVPSGALTLKEKTGDKSVIMRLTLECGPWANSPKFIFLLNATVSEEHREGTNALFEVKEQITLLNGASEEVLTTDVEGEISKSYVNNTFELLGVVITLDASFSFNFTLLRDDVKVTDTQRKEPKVVSYCFVVFCIYLVLLMQMTKQSYNFERNSFTMHVSVEMLALLSTFDFTFSLWNIVLSAADMEANSYAFLAFIWVFTSFMMLRDKAFMILSHFQEVQWSGFQVNYPSWPIKTVYAGFLIFVSLLFGALRSYCVILAVPAVLSAAPQLLRNAFLNEYCFEVNFFAACQLLGRLAIATYFFGCPANFLGLEPQPVLVVLLGSLSAGQVLLLIAQMTALGPRSIMPSSFLPKPYSYFRTREEEAPMEADRECTICMFPLQGDEKVRLMHAPCRHIFHESCLRNWMSIKMECPSCRGKLPRLEDA